ncbi:MAG: hypothetical protein V7K47_22225 [Nostoc sp.]
MSFCIAIADSYSTVFRTYCHSINSSANGSVCVDCPHGDRAGAGLGWARLLLSSGYLSSLPITKNLTFSNYISMNTVRISNRIAIYI